MTASDTVIVELERTASEMQQEGRDLDGRLQRAKRLRRRVQLLRLAVLEIQRLRTALVVEKIANVKAE